MHITNKMKRFHQNRGARQRIARALLDGPDFLIPPVKLDDFGWIEPVLRISVRPLSVNQPSYAYSVFVDDTINRDKNFLQPVVRRAYWNRPVEYKMMRIMDWPKVDIIHHTLSLNEQKAIHLQLLRLDKSFSQLEYCASGLITDRSSPRGCYPKGELPPARHLAIMRNNSCQFVEFALDEYAGKNMRLERAARALMRYIDELCSKPDSLPYRERYSKDLTNEHKGSTRWLFRPKRITKRSLTSGSS